MRQSLIDHLRSHTNLGLGQGFTVPMPDEIVDEFIEWLRASHEHFGKMKKTGACLACGLMKLADLLEAGGDDG